MSGWSPQDSLSHKAGMLCPVLVSCVHPKAPPGLPVSET